MRLIDADALMSQAFSTRQGYDAVLVEDIVNAPTVDAEPVKHAYWIKTPSPYHFKCSSCGVIANIKFHSVEDHKFCWHCGARMDGESE